MQSYRNVFARYRRRPEVTALGPDVTVCGKQTRGVLQSRPVEAATVIPIGKESNRLEEVQAGAVLTLNEVQETYQSEGKLWEEYLQAKLNRLVDERLREEVAEILDV